MISLSNLEEITKSRDNYTLDLNTINKRDVVDYLKNMLAGTNLRKSIPAGACRDYLRVLFREKKTVKLSLLSFFIDFLSIGYIPLPQQHELLLLEQFMYRNLKESPQLAVLIEKYFDKVPYKPCGTILWSFIYKNCADMEFLLSFLGLLSKLLSSHTVPARIILENEEVLAFSYQICTEGYDQDLFIQNMEHFCLIVEKGAGQQMHLEKEYFSAFLENISERKGRLTLSKTDVRIISDIMWCEDSEFQNFNFLLKIWDAKSKQRLIQLLLHINKHKHNQAFKGVFLNALLGCYRNDIISLPELDYQFFLKFTEELFYINQYYGKLKEANARHLLKLFNYLIRRSHLQVGPLSEIDRVISGKNYDFKRFPNDLVTHFFVKYEVPWAFTENFFNLDDIELEWFEQVITGTNIRKISGIPFRVLKREAHHFINLGKGTVRRADSDAIIKNLLVSKILSCGGTYTIMHAIMMSQFVRNLEQILPDMDFWETVFAFLARYKKELERHEIGPMMDYIIHQRYHVFHEAEFTLTNRTLHSVRRLMEEWHAALRKNIDINLKWKGSVKPDFTMEKNGIEYRIVQLKSSHDLFLEGKAMRHCVHSYSRECARGICTIWSLRKVENGEEQSLLTIELVNNSIEQIRGKNNRYARKEEMVIVKEWVKKVFIKNNFLYI